MCLMKASSGLSESCPQIGDVPKSPVPPFGSAVPSAGKITIEMKLRAARPVPVMDGRHCYLRQRLRAGRVVLIAPHPAPQLYGRTDPTKSVRISRVRSGMAKHRHRLSDHAAHRSRNDHSTLHQRRHIRDARHQARLVRNGRRRKTLFGAVFKPPRMPEHRHSGIEWIDPAKGKG